MLVMLVLAPLGTFIPIVFLPLPFIVLSGILSGGSVLVAWALDSTAWSQRGHELEDNIENLEKALQVGSYNPLIGDKTAAPDGWHGTQEEYDAMADTNEKIYRIKKLLDEGAITQDEFNRLKDMVLGRNQIDANIVGHSLRYGTTPVVASRIEDLPPLPPYRAEPARLVREYVMVPTEEHLEYQKITAAHEKKKKKAAA